MHEASEPSMVDLAALTARIRFAFEGGMQDMQDRRSTGTNGN